MTKGSVMVAVSGGVDSSASAALLQEAGYDCRGVFMATHDDAAGARQDAEAVCRRLDIPFDALDMRAAFEKDIVAYFCDEYRRGRTPNPCVRCNRTIKFGALWRFAQDRGADFLATGHYAKRLCVDGQHGIYQADNLAKDQSYVLSMIDRQVLPHILLPMAELSKDQTRRIAARFGLLTEHKDDSQEICFIPDDDYIGLLGKRMPEIIRKGKVVDTAGVVLGEHDGVFRFTIGQRRGLRIAMGKPMYVVAIDAATNTVTLGEKADLYRRTLLAESVNWLIDPPDEPFEAVVKIRYNHRGAAARVTAEPDGTTVGIVFDEPVSAITPGQAAVMYQHTPHGLRVAGGGWIKGTVD